MIPWSADGLPKLSCFDIRSPLGVAPAALSGPHEQLPADVHGESCAYSTQKGLQSFK